MMKAKTTTVTKAAIAASRKYQDIPVWYFSHGNNECFVIGGKSHEAFLRSHIAPTMFGVERRLYVSGRKQ